MFHWQMLLELYRFVRFKEGRTLLRGLALLLRISVILVCNVGGAFFMYQFFAGRIDFCNSLKKIIGLHRGWAFASFDGTELVNCLMQVERNNSCINRPDLNQLDTTTFGVTYQDPDGLYAPWNTSVNTAGWSNDPTSANYHHVPGQWT